jgi:hypothetical protein
MRPETAGSGWKTLQEKAHLPEVQTIIRHEISRGTIRVIPAPGGGICILPTSGNSPIEEHSPFAVIGLGEDDRRMPVPSKYEVRRRTR